MAGPTVSVVVPTKTRRDAVLRLLDALAKGGERTSPFQVVVVDDGSTDDTVAQVSGRQWPFALEVIELRGSGAAVARNAGARVAEGEVLLFLDDDVEPGPDLVAAHAAFHAAPREVVGLGDLPLRIHGRTFFNIMLRSWWEETLRSVRRTGHRYSYRDLLSGHFSIRRTLFERVGGFDEALHCREDYELGYRLVSSGIPLHFVPHAVAWHHDSTDLAKAFRRKLDEGEADVRLLRRHPALASSLPLSVWDWRPRVQRVLGWFAWEAPRVGAAVAAVLTACLPILERLKFRWRWRWLLDALLGYWYWRGVAGAIRSRAELARLVSSAPAPEAPALTIDLASGLADAEARIDETRPRALRLVFGAEEIGRVPEVPGAEPLRGIHLKVLLGKRFRREYLRALTSSGAVPETLAAAARSGSRAPGSGGHDVVAA